MLIPSLTLNYVQSLLVAKEKLLKKSSKGGYISDDGFIIGLTFLIEILEQRDSVREIHWFSEVKVKIKEEVKSLEEKIVQLSEGIASKENIYKDDESIEVGLYLRQKKGFLDEFELLENGYKAAQVLFKDKTVKERDFFIEGEVE